MSAEKLAGSTTWQQLAAHAETMTRPENHLRHLIAEPSRLDDFSASGGGLFYDYSRQRVDRTAMDLLFALAERRGVKRGFSAMANGEIVNVTEKRAALHTACRSFSGPPVMVGGRNVTDDLAGVRESIRRFSRDVHSGAIAGSTGKPFRHMVVIGIGGSYLGTEFVSTALQAHADKHIRVHYLSNVDVHNFGHVVSRIDPGTTLWIVISKSYTTAETLANTRQAYAFMQEKGLDPAGHVVTVTSQGSPGDDPGNPVLASFHMFDYIGGRYSVTSAVGGVPLSLLLGYDKFEQFLKGAEAMDLHTLSAAPRENPALIAALLSVWNNNFLGYPASAVIPYAAPLARLAPHVQQLNMESNGKSATRAGLPVDVDTGTIVFGEPGTNAQHSFFQLAHQGRPFPVEFIGVVRPQYTAYASLSKGVTNHQELWANLMAQAEALAVGKENDNRARAFSGNRPSATLVLPDLSPKSVGSLLAFYEAKTVYEALIWDINPFDQFGVELGKTTASGIRGEMARRNQDPSYGFGHLDPITRHYLDQLFSGNR